MATKAILKLPKVTQEGSGTLKLKNTTSELEDTLDILKDKFKDTIPTKVVSEQEFSRLQGQQDVIKYINQLIIKYNQ